jgi:NAD(P)H-dependent FMN reductase
MQITIVCGSHRRASQTRKIADAICACLLQHQLCEQANIFDLADSPLPLWNEACWQQDDAWQQRLAPWSSKLRSSDALVIVCPEWHGMVPAALKNFFLMWSGGELAHKPALIVAVSSTDGGAYPVAELRMSSYKNNRICYLPEHLIVRNVESVFNPHPEDNSDTAQPYFESRLRYCLELLREYAQAFRTIRRSGKTDLSVFRSGM